MKLVDMKTKAIAWYKSLSFWIAAAVAFGAGFVACYFFGAVF